MYYNVAEVLCQVKNKIYLLNPNMGLRGHGQQVRGSFPCVVAYRLRGKDRNCLRHGRIRYRRNASSQRVVGYSLQNTSKKVCRKRDSDKGNPTDKQSGDYRVGEHMR